MTTKKLPTGETTLLAAKVFVSLGFTMNMGDYNSERVDFGLTLDLPDQTDASIEAGYQRALSLLSKKRQEHIERLENIK